MGVAPEVADSSGAEETYVAYTGHFLLYADKYRDMV